MSIKKEKMKENERRKALQDYIVVIGGLNADITAFAERHPRLGESVLGKEISMSPGGKGANQANQCAKLGVKTYMIGRLGADFQGMEVLSSLRQDRVDCTFVKTVEGEKTGCALIHADAEGKNTVVYVPGANTGLEREDVEQARDIIVHAKILLTQNEISQEVVMYALKLAHQAGVVTIFNPAPASALPEEIFQYVDYITPNETENEQLTGIFQEQHPAEEWRRKSAEWFLDRGVKHVCITMGSSGVFYSDGSREAVIPAFSVKAVDTTAAGDSFHGGFAYGLFQGYPMDTALRIGCACGGMTAMRKGAQNSIRGLDEIADFMKEKGIFLQEKCG